MLFSDIIPSRDSYHARRSYALHHI